MDQTAWLFESGNDGEGQGDKCVSKLSSGQYIFDTIILIGPPEVGKTTVGALLKEKLKIGQVSLDWLRFGYYKEIGYDKSLANKLRESDLEALISYWQKFDVYAVARVLSEYRNCVIDFGAIHSVYDDSKLLDIVRNILKPYVNVILLLPTPTKEENIRVLLERKSRRYNLTWEEVQMWERVIRRFIYNQSNYILAKETVYTYGKSQKEILKDMLKRIYLMPPEMS